MSSMKLMMNEHILESSRSQATWSGGPVPIRTASAWGHDTNNHQQNNSHHNNNGNNINSNNPARYGSLNRRNTQQSQRLVSHTRYVKLCN